MARRKIHGKTINAAITAVCSGKSVAEVSKKFGVSPGTVRRWAFSAEETKDVHQKLKKTKHDVQRRARPALTDDQLTIMELRTEIMFLKATLWEALAHHLEQDQK